LIYFNINIFYEVKFNQQTLPLFLCPALLASEVQEPILDFCAKVWPENQILLNEVYTVLYYISYDIGNYTMME